MRVVGRFIEGGAHGVTRPTFSFVIALLLSTLLHQLSTSPAHAQYSIGWFTIDGGGGTSTGGIYSVSGTIGQPDAGGPMTNGQYFVTGGFWALPTAIQVTGAPTLTIAAATPGNATVSWTPNTPGFVLQETLSLSPANWINSPSGATNPIIVPATLPVKFYRLFQPTPPLTITPGPASSVTISWTPNTPGFVLQETWSLAPANWTNSPSGATNPVVVPATALATFYRMFK